MPTRRPGSGLYRASTAAVEELVAAVLRRDGDAVADQQEILRFECSIDRCGMEPARIVQLIVRALGQLGLDVSDSLAQPLDGLGDVRASLRGGSSVWFEVKAQTTKDRFAELTQTDWVRDETDLLRWMFHSDATFATRLPAWVSALLEVDNAVRYFDGWSRDSLWLADMALLVSREVRERAGIHSPADLHTFMAKKFVLHLTREGIRVIRLDHLRPVAGLLAGAEASISMNYANRTAASIPIACPGPGSRGGVHFTYHLGYPTGVVGRHKMHGISLANPREGIEVRL